MARDILKKYIGEIGDLEIVGEALDGIEAMDKTETSNPDLIFLDVNLPKLSGLNFYKSLRKKPRVIFTTAYPDFAVEGFELEAVDYLLKPFSFERFVAAVDKAKGQLDSVTQEDVLVIKQDKKIFRIPFDEIQYFESIGDYVKVFSKNKNWISSDTLKNLDQTLPGELFLRIHKSYIVGLKHIEYLEGNQLKIGDKKLPVGHSYREKVSELFRK